jgi:predicted amidohydrolase
MTHSVSAQGGGEVTAMSAIAVAQFAPGADIAANIAEMTRLAETAALRGASLVVFPEYSMFFAGALGPDWVGAAQSVDGAFASALASLSARLGIHVVAGMLEQSDGDVGVDGASERTDERGRFFNTLVVFSPTGARVAQYRKIHLYDAFGQRESDWVIPGEILEPETFSWNGFTVGLQTCYDLRFPEATRRLVDAGANLVLVPSEWVAGPLKEHHWRVLVTARAIENTVYLAAADQAPPIGAGNSMIVDPMGIEIATIGEATDVALAWPSLERLHATRAKNPSLANRRL